MRRQGLSERSNFYREPATNDSAFTRLFISVSALSICFIGATRCHPTRYTADTAAHTARGPPDMISSRARLDGLGLHSPH